MADAQTADRLAESDSCAQEPIHIIGHIQSHGMLLALSEPGSIIRQVSANVGDLAGMPPEALWGKSLEAFLGPRQFDIFQARLRADDLNSASSLRVVVGSRGLELNCVAHRHDDALIVEFELVREAHALAVSELSANIATLLTRMERASDILDYANVAASEMQRLAGYDRVMVYRFDAHWHGEVIAEAGKVAEPGEDAQTSYLGMSFPASDIPAQARELFLRNPVRAIADLESAPVPIVPEIGPLTHRPLDLTYAFLRSPSRIHVEYLQNIGIRSSLTVSIVVDGQLWGMIACHHHATRVIDCSTRAVCEMIARNLALQVALRNANAARDTRRFAHETMQVYGEAIESSNGRVDAASLQDAGFIELLDAVGLVTRLDGVQSSLGVTPAQESLMTVIDKLRTLAARGIASTESLSLLDPAAASFAADASGALYIELSKRTGDYLLFLRPELIATLVWAGNPDKTVTTDLAGKLHPRRSFAAWQEAVRGRAQPWSELDFESARSLRALLLYLRNIPKLFE